MTADPTPKGSIDVHAHLLPKRAADALGRPGELHVDTRDDTVLLTLRGRRITLPRALVDESALVAAAERRGVTQSVASPPPFAYAYDLDAQAALRWSMALNDASLQVQSESAGRVLAVVTLPMHQPEAAAKEVARCAEAGAAAVTIATHPGVWIDDPSLDPVWRAAADHDLPVMLHPHHVDGRYGDETHHLRNTVGNPFETSYAQARLVFSGWLARHPDVRLLLSHGGGALTALVGRWTHAARYRPGVSIAADGWPSRFTYDTIVFDDRVLRSLIDIVGPDRVAYGTDVPFDMADATTAFDIAERHPTHTSTIMRTAAQRWLHGDDQRGEEG